MLGSVYVVSVLFGSSGTKPIAGTEDAGHAAVCVACRISDHDAEGKASRQGPVPSPRGRAIDRAFATLAIAHFRRGDDQQARAWSSLVPGHESYDLAESVGERALRDLHDEASAFLDAVEEIKGDLIPVHVAPLHESASVPRASRSMTRAQLATIKQIRDEAAKLLGPDLDADPADADWRRMLCRYCFAGEPDDPTPIVGSLTEAAVRDRW